QVILSLNAETQTCAVFLPYPMGGIPSRGTIQLVCIHLDGYHFVMLQDGMQGQRFGDPMWLNATVSDFIPVDIRAISVKSGLNPWQSAFAVSPVVVAKSFWNRQQLEIVWTWKLGRMRVE